MKNLFVVTFIVLLSSFRGHAQKGTLAYDRGIFHTRAYHHTFKQSNKQLMALYRNHNVFEAERLLHKSKVLVPIGAVTSIAGIALGVDALIGTKHTAYIDNQEHVYYKRPILKLVSGLGLLAAGICLIEFGNDAKINSINVFNKNQTSFSGKVGFTDSGNLGLQLKIN